MWDQNTVILNFSSYFSNLYKYGGRGVLASHVGQGCYCCWLRVFFSAIPSHPIRQSEITQTNQLLNYWYTMNWHSLQNNQDRYHCSHPTFQKLHANFHQRELHQSHSIQFHWFPIHSTSPFQRSHHIHHCSGSLESLKNKNVSRYVTVEVENRITSKWKKCLLTKDRWP